MHSGHIFSARPCYAQDKAFRAMGLMALPKEQPKPPPPRSILRKQVTTHHLQVFNGSQGGTLRPRSSELPVQE